MQGSSHSEMPSLLELISVGLKQSTWQSLQQLEIVILIFLHQASDSSMALPLHEQFQKQKLANAIESASDMTELKGVASLLLDLYFRQKSATIDIVEGKI